MSRFFQRPENAIKRADDLLGVSQPGAALNLLFDVLVSRRNKSAPFSVMEPIAMRFIELSVEQKKGRLVREVLHKYKQTYQGTNLESVVATMMHYVTLSEKKVETAQAEADKLTLDENVEDLEATETPESILLSTVSSEIDKDRMDREVVTPWLKFLWEAYKTVLETLRKKRDPEAKNNYLLDELQQKVASQAFDFCLKYTRKTEFHRLCTTLKGDLIALSKQDTTGVGMDMELIQRYLDTRFIQIKTATELQLWQKAFETAEDIQVLFGYTKNVSKPHLAEYYNKLAKIFTVGQNHLFQAAALAKFYNIMRHKQSLSESEHQVLASKVLLSALAVPIISTSNPYESRDSNTQLLINLLRVQRTPTRESLLKDSLSRHVFNKVLPEVKELYKVLEVEFHPLLITKKVAPQLKALMEKEEFKEYVAPLQEVILTRILQQLSQVYTTVKIDFVVQQTSFRESGFAYNSLDIERFIVNGCKRGELSIRVNHQERTISFVNDFFSGSRATISEGPKIVSLPTDQVRTQISRLAKRLHSVGILIEKTQVANGILPENRKPAARAKIFEIARQRMELERRAVNARTELLLKKRESRINATAVKMLEEEEQRKTKADADREAERLRIEREAKRREEERRQQQLIQIEKTVTAERVATIQEDMKARNIVLDIKDPENIDPDSLITLQVQYLDQQLKDRESKRRAAFRKLDHIIRAYRKEEVKLLANDYERQKQKDKKLVEVINKAAVSSAQAQYKGNMDAKKRMLRMISDVSSLEGERMDEYKARVARATQEAEKQALAAKKKRIEQVKAQMAEQRRMQEEEERRRVAESSKREAAARQVMEMEKERIRMEEEKRAARLAREAELAGDESKEAPSSDIPSRDMSSRDMSRDMSSRDMSSRDMPQREGPTRAAGGGAAPYRPPMRSANPDAAGQPPAAGGDGPEGGAWRRGGAAPPPRRDLREGDSPSTNSAYAPPSRRPGAYAPPSRR